MRSLIFGALLIQFCFSTHLFGHMNEDSDHPDFQLKPPSKQEAKLEPDEKTKLQTKNGAKKKNQKTLKHQKSKQNFRPAPPPNVE